MMDQDPEVKIVLTLDQRDVLIPERALQFKSYFVLLSLVLADIFFLCF